MSVVVHSAQDGWVLRGVEDGLRLCTHTCVLVGKSMTWRLEGFLDPARHEFALVAETQDPG